MRLRLNDGSVLCQLVVSRWFEDRSPFVEFLGRDPEGPRRGIEVPVGQTFVELLDGLVEEDRLHAGSEFPSTFTVVMSLLPTPDAPVQDDADSTGQQPFDEFPLHLMDEELPLIPGGGLGVVGIQLTDPGIGVQKNSLASGFEFLCSYRFA